MRILVVGISVRAVAASAVGGGLSVVALDAFGDRDLRALCETRSLHGDFQTGYSAEALYHAGRGLRFDAIAYTSDLENHPAILKRFAESHPIIGNSPETVSAVRSWKALFLELRAAGFSAPDTFFHGESGAGLSGRRWLSKPLLSGGGHGIRFADAAAAEETTMIQEHLPGKPCSTTFLANGRECVLLGITEQLIGLEPFGATGFRYCGNLLPASAAADAHTGRMLISELRRMAVFLTERYGLIGLNGFDFILEGGRPFLTEVNPRYSASMELVERAYRLPLFRLHVDAALSGKLPEFRIEHEILRGGVFGKTILFAEKDAAAPDTEDWAAENLCDIPASGEKLHRNSPICTILAHGSTREEAMARLTRQAEALKRRIYSGVDIESEMGAGSRRREEKCISGM